MKNFIAVAGNIGVGKSTLVRIMEERLGWEPFYEAVVENPYLADFYADMPRYAFHSQIFFLLSRYRQQHEAVPAALARGTLISDYTFDKNKIFARLTIDGDELEMYERVQDILAGRIPLPSLVVYLRASLDVIMERITLRDRIYERGMEREYIDSLCIAYDDYFSTFRAAPVLILETDDLDFVHNRSILDQVAAQIGAKLSESAYQEKLL